MTLNVAVQMDPIQSINIAGDSSFALLLSAQARGHALWYYDVTTLTWDEGAVFAWAAPFTVQRVDGDHVQLGNSRGSTWWLTSTSC